MTMMKSRPGLGPRARLYSDLTAGPELGTAHRLSLASMCMVSRQHDTVISSAVSRFSKAHDVMAATSPDQLSQPPATHTEHHNKHMEGSGNRALETTKYELTLPTIMLPHGT